MIIIRRRIILNMIKMLPQMIMIFTLRAMRMIRLVRLRLRTSLLVEALETTSRAVANSGAASSWAAARATIEKHNQIFFINDDEIIENGKFIIMKVFMMYDETNTMF